MLTVAYIGFGNSVVRYHLPYVERRDDYIKVKFIYRRAEDRVGAAEQERETWYPDITFTSDIDEVMKDDEVNLIVINSPDEFHVEYTMAALKHGKNVLVEKPLALTSEEAREVFAFAKEKGLLVMSNNNRRYDPDMRTIRKVMLICMAMVILAPGTAMAQENKGLALTIDAKAAVIMEASSGEIIFEQNGDERRAPASVTKVMTMLLIYEALEQNRIAWDDVVTVSEYAAGMGGSQIYLEPMEQQTVRDLVKSVVIASANDGAVALAEFISGSE